MITDLEQQFDLRGALKRALGGGLSGAAAMILQVLLLMVRHCHISIHLFLLTILIATAYGHELPVSPWYGFQYRGAYSISRWRGPEVLSRHCACIDPGLVAHNFARDCSPSDESAIGPVSRFGDTAANAGILALLRSNPYLRKLPSPIQTIFASLWLVQVGKVFCNMPNFNAVPLFSA